jgi:hypothetical protein
MSVKSQKMLDASDKACVVVTTIQPPTESMRSLAQGCAKHGVDLLVIGDKKSPNAPYNLEGASFYDISKQFASGLLSAIEAPLNHYSRKNVGYLLAIQQGARLIIETDDDNTPLSSFWAARSKAISGRRVTHSGWVNAYRYFSSDVIWPRGLPLDAIKDAMPQATTEESLDCPIQQGLANGDPDVDAVFRLTRGLPFNFSDGLPVVLGAGTWCPFNSQNTTFFRKAFPLLYLPSYCSFRMTDIWRSFVAQAIAYANEWNISFHMATVFQDRNKHDLMRDFSDEVVGYLHNGLIREELLRLPLAAGEANIATNLLRCYEKFVSLSLVDARELHLLNTWLSDLDRIG